MTKRVVVIGAGHMGTAIILGLLHKHCVDLYVVDPNESRCNILKERHGLDVATSPKNIRDNDTVIFNPPGWRTPSEDLLEYLLATDNADGLTVPTMFYGDGLLLKFLQELPSHLKRADAQLLA